MSTENNEQKKEEEKNPPNDIQQPIEPSSKPLISEDIKKLLDSLLKKTLDKRIIRLETRSQDQLKTAALVKKHYDTFTNQIKSIVKNNEETLKKKAAKSKEETHKKGKTLDKHPLASKSVPPGKKFGAKPKDNNTSRVEKKKLNIHTNTSTHLKTEENTDKDSHKRAKSFKQKRIFSESNIKKGKKKLVKKTETPLSPFGNEDIKAKTLTNYHTEKNILDSRKKLNSTTVEKNKTKDKTKKNSELAKTFSEANIDKKKKN